MVVVGGSITDQLEKNKRWKKNVFILFLLLKMWVFFLCSTLRLGLAGFFVFFPVRFLLFFLVRRTGEFRFPRESESARQVPRSPAFKTTTDQLIVKGQKRKRRG